MTYDILKLPVYNPDRSILTELEVFFDSDIKSSIISYNWKLQYQQGLWRVFKNPSYKRKKTTNFLHNFIWELKFGKILEGYVIDHINHNSLDNRISNLRMITKKQNSYNIRPNKNGSSVYKGVHWNKPTKKWRAKIMFNGKSLHLGNFEVEKDAAKVYDQKAKELFGQHAYLNFPGGDC